MSCCLSLSRARQCLKKVCQRLSEAAASLQGPPLVKMSYLVPPATLCSLPLPTAPAAAAAAGAEASSRTPYTAAPAGASSAVQYTAAAGFADGKQAGLAADGTAAATSIAGSGTRANQGALCEGSEAAGGPRVAEKTAGQDVAAASFAALAGTAAARSRDVTEFRGDLASGGKVCEEQAVALGGVPELSSLGAVSTYSARAAAAGPVAESIIEERGPYGAVAGTIAINAGRSSAAPGGALTMVSPGTATAQDACIAADLEIMGMSAAAGMGSVTYSELAVASRESGQLGCLEFQGVLAQPATWTAEQTWGVEDSSVDALMAAYRSLNGTDSAPS